MKRSYLLAAVIAAHILPVAAWAAVKPLRIVAPELLGLTCTADDICVDDPQRIPEARALLADARAFVSRELGELQRQPRAVFCSTATCAKAFGLGRSVAFSVGTVGIIISEQAWEPFYVRHELIHQLQNERLGTLTAWLFKPSWLIEGMAYARSLDPRDPLPQPLQAWRERYQAWEREVGASVVWPAAERVQ